MVDYGLVWLLIVIIASIITVHSLVLSRHIDQGWTLGQLSLVTILVNELLLVQARSAISWVLRVTLPSVTGLGDGALSIGILIYNCRQVIL